MCLLINLIAHVVCNYDFIVESEGLLNVTHRHLHCVSDDILKMVQYGGVFTSGQ